MIHRLLRIRPVLSGDITALQHNVTSCPLTYTIHITNQEFGICVLLEPVDF
jgi:hypothetical protein